MKNFKVLFFDADDTLFDFQSSERAALRSCFEHFDITADVERNYLADYQKINKECWDLFERGELAKDRLRSLRFERFFALHQISVCPVQMGELYLERLPQHVFIFDEAHAVCESLSQHFELAIITNGIASHQQARLARSGLADFFSVLISSEACGWAKPDRRIFDFALSKTDFQNEDALMIGDRLETDILGAQNAGIKNCWFNPNGQENLTDVQPDHQIQRLSELKTWLALTP